MARRMARRRFGTTPVRKRVWARSDFSATLDAATPAAFDLLGPYKAARGIQRISGTTVGPIKGRICATPVDYPAGTVMVRAWWGILVTHGDVGNDQIDPADVDHRHLNWMAYGQICMPRTTVEQTAAFNGLQDHPDVFEAVTGAMRKIEELEDRLFFAVGVRDANVDVHVSAQFSTLMRGTGI